MELFVLLLRADRSSDGPNDDDDNDKTVMMMAMIIGRFHPFYRPRRPVG